MRTKSFVCCALTVVSLLAISFLGLAFYYYDEDLYNRMLEKDGNEVFQSMILAENAFVMFYSLESHSNGLDENWQRLDHIVKYNETYKSIYMGKVECSVFRPMCRQFHLEKYPSIVWMQKGKIVDIYAGDNSMNDMKFFLDNKFHEHVIQHDTEIFYTVSVLNTERTTMKPLDTTQAKSLFESIFDPMEEIINKFKNIENNQTKTSEFEPLPKLPVEEPNNKNKDSEKLQTEVIVAHSQEKIRIFIPNPNDNQNHSRKHIHSNSTEEKPWESISDKNSSKNINDEHDYHHMHTSNEAISGIRKTAQDITTKIIIFPSTTQSETISHEKYTTKESKDIVFESKEVSSTKRDKNHTRFESDKSLKSKEKGNHKFSSRRGESDEKAASKTKEISSEITAMTSEELAKLFEKKFEKVKKVRKVSKDQTNKNDKKSERKVKPKIRGTESSEQSEEVKSIESSKIKIKDKSIEVKSEKTKTTDFEEDEFDESKEEVSEEKISKEEEEETKDTDDFYEYEEKTKEISEKGDKYSTKTKTEAIKTDKHSTIVNDDNDDNINISDLFKEQPIDSQSTKIIDKKISTEKFKEKPKSSHI